MGALVGCLLSPASPRNGGHSRRSTSLGYESVPAPLPHPLSHPSVLSAMIRKSSLRNVQASNVHTSAAFAPSRAQRWLVGHLCAHSMKGKPSGAPLRPQAEPPPTSMACSTTPPAYSSWATQEQGQPYHSSAAAWEKGEAKARTLGPPSYPATPALESSWPVLQNEKQPQECHFGGHCNLSLPCKSAKRDLSTTGPGPKTGSPPEEGWKDPESTYA